MKLNNSIKIKKSCNHRKLGAYNPLIIELCEVRGENLHTEVKNVAATLAVKSKFEGEWNGLVDMIKCRTVKMF